MKPSRNPILSCPWVTTWEIGAEEDVVDEEDGVEKGEGEVS